MLPLLIAIFGIIASLIVIYFRTKFGYWKARNVLTLPNPGIPWGHLSNPLSSASTNLGIHVLETYHYCKSHKKKHGGFYMGTIPIYIPINLDLIKHILIQDFNYFDEKGLYYNEEEQPLSAHMFQVGGEKWRRVRQKLSPTFTSGKLKGMFHIIEKCSHSLMAYIATKDVVEIKEAAAKYTINVIGNCAFGLDTNCFENESSEFYKYGQKIFTVDFKRALSGLVILFFPDIAYKLNLVHHYKAVERFFTEIVTETVRLREAKEVPEREDFINLMLELKKEGNGFDLQDIITQSFVFFAAGFETSASAISNVLYETSQQPKIQLKMKQEIDAVLKQYNGELTYDALRELTYMGQVIEETLRKYPPLTILNREVSQDYQVPDSDLLLQKGTKVFVPTLAIHWDEEYYPRPHIFDPERFSAENKKNNKVCSWLGFGDGPRQCIGLRFAQLQTKIALTYLFKTYNFKLHESSRKPLTFTKSMVLSPKEAILIEKQPWTDTNIEEFCKEERTILPNKDISLDSIYKLLFYGDIP